MTKAKSAKTTRITPSKAPSVAKAPVKAPAKVSASTKATAKAKATTKAKAVPQKHPMKDKADWSRTIRQALQERQAPKTWPGGGSEPWKGAPTKKN